MRPVHIDGSLYVAIAFTGAIASALGSDDAAKYIDAPTLWFAKNIFTAIAAGLLALKMYRSTALSKDQQEQSGTKDLLVKPPATVTVETPAKVETTVLATPVKTP